MHPIYRLGNSDFHNNHLISNTLPALAVVAQYWAALNGPSPSWLATAITTQYVIAGDRFTRFFIPDVEDVVILYSLWYVLGNSVISIIGS